MPKLSNIILGDRPYPSLGFPFGASATLTPAANDLAAPKLPPSFSASLAGAFPTMYVRLQTQSALLAPPAETKEAF